EIWLTAATPAPIAATEAEEPTDIPLRVPPLADGVSAPRQHHLVDPRDHSLAVGGQRRVLRVVLEIEPEVTRAHALEPLELLDVRLRRPDQAEALHDLVGDELGVLVAGAPVGVVVITAPVLDVVAEALGDRPAVGAVAVDDVDDVVADHAPEPPDLVQRMALLL